MGDGFHNSGLTGRAWFRPAVALWFALLLGGGLWLMPPNVHAVIARSTGLAGIHPMFAAPVATAGVAILCGAVAIAGLLFGLWIAGRIAAASAPRAFAPGFEGVVVDSWDEGETAEELDPPRRRRVFSAREDIGEEGIATSALAADQGEEGEEADYEAEYTIRDIPATDSGEEFEAVYSELEADYDPEPAASNEDDAPENAFPEDAPQVDAAEIPYAEFEAVVQKSDPVEQAWNEEHLDKATESFVQADPAPEGSMLDGTPTDEALGDMSLEALLGRLEGALEQHKALVAGSEEAAREPAPQPLAMTRLDADLGDENRKAGLADIPHDDPVIAFLRREASRRMPDRAVDMDELEEEIEATSHDNQNEAQAALRSALDRLGQTTQRD